MKYPEYIMKYLRQRWSLNENDRSKDDVLQSLSADTVFSEVLQWKGLLGGWDTLIKEWIRDIYGIDIDAEKF